MVSATPELPPMPADSGAHRRAGQVALPGVAGDAATIAFIGFIAFVAQATGLVFVLFPELGALSHDILRRPQGAWARAPVMLVVTPFLTATVGTVLTRNFAYGPLSVLAAIGAARAIIRLLRSPIGPAISAGLLPLVLGLRDWRYPPSVLVGGGAPRCWR